MAPNHASLDGSEGVPSQRAQGKRKIDSIVLADTDSEDEHDPHAAAADRKRQQKGKGKAKGKAVPRPNRKRVSVLVIPSSEDEDDDYHPTAPLAPATSSASSSTHQPDNSASPPRDNSKEDVTATILSIIPDVDLAYLDGMLDQQLAGPGTVARGMQGYDIAAIVDELLTKGSYPKEGQAEREAQAQADRDARVDWSDLSWRGDGKQMSSLYKDQA